MNTNNSGEHNNQRRHAQYRDYYAEDEISFVDLALVIMCRWKIGLLAFFLVVAITVVYLLIQEQQYESSAVIAIGTMGKLDSNLNTDKVYLEYPGVLIREIEQTDIGKQIPAKISKISLDEGRFVEITAVSNQPEAAKQLLEAVINNILNEHSRVHSEITDEYQNAIKHLKTRLENAISGEDADISIADTQSAILSLRIASSEPVLSKTRVIQPPDIPTRPERPNYKLIMALSGVLGGGLAIMAIFIAEFISNIRRELGQRNQHK